ncbi:MAG: DUF1080 domain-containing protein [Bacteroidetes bacterium]|nr:DUF1080 domain-containing protein [Bacteroidota bacterium]
MKLYFFISILIIIVSVSSSQAQEKNKQKSPKGFISLFDGETLKGWKAADMSWWSVEESAITARITKEKPCKDNQYLFCEYGTMTDFELKLKYRLVSEHNVNGGFQFRSEHYEGDDCKGYQVDNNTETDWLVRLYDEFGRHTLAWRGERTVFDKDGNTTKTDIPKVKKKAHFKLNKWHNYYLICKGNTLTLFINGKLIAEVVDNVSLSKNRFVSLIFGLNIAVLGLRTESISSSLFD